MKKFKALSFLAAFVFVIGFSSCEQDETLNELIDATELGEPLNDNSGGNGEDPTEG